MNNPDNNPFREVEYFEKELALFCGSKYCCAVDSCTSGFFLILNYFKWKNKNIIFPRKTYLSMPMMALATGNKVIFQELEWSGLYPIKIENYPDILLFDSAKRLRKNDFIPGSIMFKSFHMKKHITSISGKGGAILTDDKQIYDWCVKARWEGRNPYSDYKSQKEDIEIIGFNMNMTPEEAVFLRRQLQNHPENSNDLDEPNGYRNLDEFSIFSNCKIIDNTGKILKKSTNKLSNDFFDLRQKTIHGDKYIRISDYVGMSKKIKIKCNIHGEFEQRAQSHLEGQGCPSCNSLPRKDLEYLKKIAIDRGGECLSISYTNMKSDYKWKCKCGNEWFASGSEIACGNWCPICRYKIIAEKNTKHNIEYLHFLAKQNYGKCLSEKYIKIISKYIWECKRGHIFRSKASDVSQGKWCKKCRESKGERAINLVLTNLGVSFEREYIFKDCKDEKYLPFDFYLPDYNLCIEYDGSQHFKQPTGYWKKFNLEKIQFRDEIKTKYCKENNIKLIRIPYTLYKKIGDIICFEYENKFSRNLNLSETLKKNMNIKGTLK